MVNIDRLRKFENKIGEIAKKSLKEEKIKDVFTLADIWGIVKHEFSFGEIVEFLEKIGNNDIHKTGRPIYGKLIFHKKDKILYWEPHRKKWNRGK